MCASRPDISFAVEFQARIACHANGVRNMPVGRPIQYDPDAVVEAAMQTFWTRGYEATALPDLLAATGLSRSSLYQVFGSKQGLFETCLAHYAEGLAQEMKRALDQSARGIEFLQEVLQGFVEDRSSESRRRGCLVLNSAREFSCRDPKIAKLVNASAQRMMGLFEAAIRRAQAEGDIPMESDPRALAAFFLSSVSGLRNMLQTRMERDLLREAAARILASLRA